MIFDKCKAYQLPEITKELKNIWELVPVRPNSPRCLQNYSHTLTKYSLVRISSKPRNTFHPTHALDEPCFNFLFQKSVNALLAVRRMSLSPLSVAKRRSSMDPSILKTTPEGEEDQTNDADRKGSEPIDPSSLTLPLSRRFGETRSSCFDLDMKTLRALQEKADKAIGKKSQKDENDNGDESSSGDSDLNDNDDDDDDDDDQITDLNNTHFGEPENPRRGSDISNLVNRESCSFERPRANTFCGATSRERKVAHVSINLENTSQTDFKPVSFTFNTNDLRRNGRPISESVTPTNAQTKTNDSQQDFTMNAGDRSNDTEDASVSTNSTNPVDQARKGNFKPQKLTVQLDKSVVNDEPTNSTGSHQEELPTICVNDELYVTSPPPTSLTFNNNIEKMDRQELMSTQPSLQNTSGRNIANVNIIPDGVQAITVQLGNLNGLQLNPKQVSCSVSRSSTESASC